MERSDEGVCSRLDRRALGAPLGRRCALVLVPLLLFASVHVAGASIGLDSNDIPTLFSVRKTENRNRVDYGIRVDDACHAVGAVPVQPYWRMLEEGADVTEPLRRVELRAYGIASQRVDASGARVDLRLRALGDRTLTISLRTHAAGRCTATVSVPIQGAACTLEDVLVVQSGRLSVDYVDIRGRTLREGTWMHERLSP